jgi:hypothetical protein
MLKIKVLISRILSMSFKRMFMYVNQIHQETKKLRFFIFLDMIWCLIRYNIGYLDYKVFGFALIRGKRRKTFMTMNHNLALSKAFNMPGYGQILDNKLEFNYMFSDYLKRDWLDLSKANSEDFKKYIKNKKNIFAKAIDSFGGQGVELIDLSEIKDYDQLFKDLKDKRQYLIEDVIIQHDKMNLLCPKSVNTIRIVTLLVNGETHIMYALLRMGDGIKSVDNISSGGMYTIVSKDGILRKKAFCDKTGLYYDEHPFTHQVFFGFEIPCFFEAIELCKQASKVIPQLGYVGWDVAITPNGPVLVEGNQIPGYDMCQNYHQLDDDKQGILPSFKAVAGDFLK